MIGSTDRQQGLVGWSVSTIFHVSLLMFGAAWLIQPARIQVAAGKTSTEIDFAVETPVPVPVITPPVRAVFERGCLAGWMVLMIANTVVLGLSAELLIFGGIFSFYHLTLINEHTAPLLVLGVFAILNFPVIVKLREYGVENLNFEIHERVLSSFVDPPESWSNIILTLLDETALRSHELVILVRLIDGAPGPVERQDRRAEAKAWLRENRNKLTDEDKEFVNDYLGYLR